MDFEDFYMKDDFEDKYADDLEALHDQENEDHEVVYEDLPSRQSSDLRAKSKKRLFESPEKLDTDIHIDKGKNDCELDHDEQLQKRPRVENVKTFDSEEKPITKPESHVKNVSSEVSGETYDNSNKNETLENVCETKKHFNPRKYDPSYDSMTVTAYNGDRIYVRLNKDDENLSILTDRCRRESLLGVPYRVLRDQVERSREARLLKMTEFPVDLIEDSSASIQESTNSDTKTSKHDESQLWVEKFKPKCYTELLSDDGINRTLLCWLKQWDVVVFKTESTVNKVIKEKPKEFLSYKDNFIVQKLKETDELKRPFFKVALLCGNPGLGKTTLAYIIAQHAGYNVVEMNASDDRSQEAFQRQLESATQMRSVLEQNPKPNCLIIDEIDGAPAASINVLISYVKSVKSAKKNVPILFRPIICICNDLYTPALRPLRQIAFVLNFPTTVSSRLTTRLIDITRKQFIHTDRTTLLALCTKTENDIRSCLSTLQFLGNKQKEIRLCDIKNVNIGQKDMQKSIFSIWKSLFQLPRPNKKYNDSVEVDESSFAGRFWKILNDVSQYGEYEKLLQGFFENYLKVNFKDPLLEYLNNGTEWLCFSDLIQQQISQSQNYSLMPYFPYVFVQLHFLFAVIAPPKLNYPSAQFEHKNREMQLKNIVEAMYNFMCPLTRSSFSFSVVAMQLFPWLTYIIQPTLRPVNILLYSEREKAELKHVISVMKAYNLTYRQERSPDGTYSYILEPNIEEVIRFSGLKIESSLSYATKNLILRELEMEKMRHSERTNVPDKVQPAIPAVRNPVQHYKQAVKSRKITSQVIAKDFFGREIVKAADSDANESKNTSQTGEVWFHFKEGYSNAARHTVLIQDLL